MKELGAGRRFKWLHYYLEYRRDGQIVPALRRAGIEAPSRRSHHRRQWLKSHGFEVLNTEAARSRA